MVTKDHLEQAKAHVISLVKTFTPSILNGLWPGLGSIFELGVAYTEERAAQNHEQLIEQLSFRVQNLEETLSKITDGAMAEKIIKLMQCASEETNSEKISFYAAVIAGELLQTHVDWDKELQDQFVMTIGKLTGPELIILQALYKRKHGEAIPISRRGGTWLDPRIVNNVSGRAWIDSLISKGLVADASIEQLSNNHIPHPVKSGSAYRLSNFARSMIDFMTQIQKATEPNCKAFQK